MNLKFKSRLLTFLAASAVLAFTAVVFQSCDDEEELLPPVINSFDPNTGDIGQAIVIKGQNFSTTPEDNLVEFTGNNDTKIRADVSIASATSLTVTVPQGALPAK